MKYLVLCSVSRKSAIFFCVLKKKERNPQKKLQIQSMRNNKSQLNKNLKGTTKLKSKLWDTLDTKYESHRMSDTLTHHIWNIFRHHRVGLYRNQCKPCITQIRNSDSYRLGLVLGDLLLLLCGQCVEAIQRVVLVWPVREKKNKRNNRNQKCW